jgi:hypothetical protein
MPMRTVFHSLASAGAPTRDVATPSTDRPSIPDNFAVCTPTSCFRPMGRDADFARRPYLSKLRAKLKLAETEAGCRTPAAQGQLFWTTLRKE